LPRKSAAALSVLSPVDGRPSRLRPRPHMPREVREIFVDLVASRPPEHFRAEDADLLEQHAQGIALARQAYAELEASGPVVNGKASPWLVVLEKAHRSCVALSGRLRLAPQMRLDRKAAGSRQRGPGLSYYDLAKMREEPDGDD
jgi:hypothetical protein